MFETSVKVKINGIYSGFVLFAMQQSHYPIKTRFPKYEVQTDKNTLATPSLDQSAARTESRVSQCVRRL